MKKYSLLITFIFALLVYTAIDLHAQQTSLDQTPPIEKLALKLSKHQLSNIGLKIYRNETGAKKENLIAWNQGEDFASLGIGHFIWFPKDLNSRFTETFPDLLDFFIKNDVEMPLWLRTTRDLPWGTKEAFKAARRGDKMQSLEKLLLSTFNHQIEFIYERMQAALPKMLAPALLEELGIQGMEEGIEARFNSLLQSEQGLYALIDYVNFKGEGIAASERYEGMGWGLLQVLVNMEVEGEKEGLDEAQHNIANELKAFSDACKKVLSRRVANSTQPEVEQRWLPGWKKRCDTYKVNAKQ
ncbi:hypothetical protein ISG33_10480 [Glaciecola sp. MH2013]|uniref:hypothetical protein n=1 Tax=Glaciecola sp. MH2013 TaxID=2785524 RepID=UPI00189E09EE|nr:hypothetical protein [Glaciecola sp. MH2013]MBF7073824.1 hypothetical protein [Glaciecola sp. MH2013]